MATETVQTEVTEGKTLETLEKLKEKNPKQNYHAVATIAMSASDIDAEMRNPDSQIRKDLLAAIDVLDFIAFFNNVLLPQMVKKDMEIREMLGGMDIYPRPSSSQHLREEDLIQLLPQDVKRIEPLKQLLIDVSKLEKLTAELKQIQVDWQAEKVNFVKEKLDVALKKIEERIKLMPQEDPQREELIQIKDGLKSDIAKFNSLHGKLIESKNNETDPELLSTLSKDLSQFTDNLDLDKIMKAADPMNSLTLIEEFKKGLTEVDDKFLKIHNTKVGEISSLKNSLTSSIEKYESSFGKNLGLGDMVKKFETTPNQTITALKDALNLDIPQKNAHDVNHFKK